MKTETKDLVASHDWESWAGRAPYRFVTIITTPSTTLAEANLQAYNNAMVEASQQAQGFGVTLCSCYRCGQGLHNNCVCQNADGKYFVVGIDCVRKCGDTKFVTSAEKAEKKRQKEIRDERNKIKWEKQREAREAKLQRERDKNGGETDREKETRMRNEMIEAERKPVAAANEWLAEVLEAADNGGSFCMSVANDLRSGRQRVADLPPRCLQICGDIYAKHVSGHSRRSSKAYEQARDEFEAKVEEL